MDLDYRKNDVYFFTPELDYKIASSTVENKSLVHLMSIFFFYKRKVDYTLFSFVISFTESMYTFYTKAKSVAFSSII